METNPYHPPDSELDKPIQHPVNPALWSIAFAGIIIVLGLMDLGRPSLTAVGAIVVAVAVYWIVTRGQEPSANS